MNREEILAKSWVENQNRDIVVQKILKQAITSAVVVKMAPAVIFFAAQILVGSGTNWGKWALFFSAYHDKDQT